MIPIKRHLRIVVNRISKYSIRMSETFAQKSEVITKIFTSLSPDKKYEALIELGRKLPPLPESLKTENHLVAGCQSRLYIVAELKEGKIYFQAAADALISAGLAALFISVYSGETPETVLKASPSYIKDLGLENSLSPSRSNGLYQIHLRLKQEVLKNLVLV